MSKKKRGIMDDAKLFDVKRNDEGKLPADEPAIEERPMPEARMPEDVLSDATPGPKFNTTVLEAAEPEAVSVKMVPPFTVKGSGIFDGSGRRIAICGFDHNREKSGPSIAQSISSVLGKSYK